MAGDGDILALLGSSDLAAFQNNVLGDSIFAQLSPAIGAARFDTSTWSPQEKLGTSLAQAFVSAALGRYAKNDASSQVAKVATVLPDLYANPTAVVMPEGVDESAFNILKGTATLKNLQRQSQAADEMRKFKLDIMKEMFGEEAKAAAAAKYAGQGKKAEKLAEMEAYDEISKRAQEALGGKSEEGVAPQYHPDDPRNKIQQEAWSDTDALRKELNARQELVEFNDIKNKMEVLIKASADPRSTSDLDYVYGIAKILDPGAVVRESDAGMIIQSNSIPASTLGYLNKFLGGGTTLDTSQRRALLDLAKRHYDTRATTVGGLLDKYEGIAKSRRLPVEQVLPFGRDALALQLPETGIDLRALAGQFPSTPEGRAAFKQKVAEMQK